MAVIAGVLQREGSPVEADRLARVADALALFGPRLDQWRNGPVGFLCRSAPSIPTGLDDCGLVRCAGNEVVLFHGFLHARDEVADAVKAGPAANERTDAELFGLAWELWKDEAFERVLGEFSAVAWDSGRRRLLASCSAGMPPPLCYWVGRDSAVVASVPRGVLAWSGRPRRLNDEHLGACLAGDLSDVSGTCWEDVSSLPPGETLSVTPAAHRVRRWHILAELDGGSRSPASPADWAEATWAVLRRAVGSAARAETPAIMLSGGLDSAALALAMLDLLAERPGAPPLLSVTLRPTPEWDEAAYPGALTDEWPLVRALAKTQPRLDARFAHAIDTKWDRGLERRFNLAEAPPVRYSNIEFARRCRQIAREEGRRVLLNGGAGNATFSFDGWRRLAELLRTGRVLALWKETRANPRRLWGQALLPLLPVRLQRRFPHRVHGHWRWTKRSLIHPNFARSINFPEAANERRWHPLAKSVREAQWVMMNGFAPRSCEIRSSLMASQVVWGVASRTPLSDRRFVEWCMSLPSAQYMENGVTRRLAKRMLRGRVPLETLSEPRRGVQDGDWHMRLTPDIPAIQEEVADWKRDPAVAERMDIGRLERVLETWPEWASWVPRHDDWWLARGLTETVAMGRFIRWAERA